MACHARSRVYRPGNEEEVIVALADARRRGLTVVARGSGLSYGDAALNQGGATLLTTRLGGIVDFDPERGNVRARAGTTMRELWRTVLPLGWWPPVVPGTMEVTLGGAVGMNIHGKNQLVKGSIGEHVVSLSVVRGDGTLERLTAAERPAEIRRVVGAQGLTGTVTDVTLRLQRVHSGYLEVESLNTRDIVETLDVLEERAPGAAYAVAWIDCLPEKRAGRGILHFADHLPPDHALGGKGLSLEDQDLPSRLLGVVPRDMAWMGLRPLANDPGMRFLNTGRFLAGRLRHGHRYVQSHAAFHFLLDYVPGWKRVYAPHGLIQYQLFVPREAARRAYREALALQHRLGVHAWLGVVKRHRADDFVASYSVDGFSLALDIPVRPGRLDRLRALCRSYDDLLARVGGKLYAAKDAVGRGILPRDRHPLFSSNLVRRWEAGG
ncbi:MAG: FAD-binding oxidoreductase [Gemmatimonadota bacterium]|jgi:FAD/FMN-containing dehydrogenase